VAALGHALESLGERVLMIDLCPENLLRLHFNLLDSSMVRTGTSRPGV
jgi:cellulose biosynthesis protein BcsQ